MNYRKTTALITALALMLSAVSCGSKKEKNADENDKTETTTVTVSDEGNESDDENDEKSEKEDTTETDEKSDSVTTTSKKSDGGKNTTTETGVTTTTAPKTTRKLVIVDGKVRTTTFGRATTTQRTKADTTTTTETTTTTAESEDGYTAEIVMGDTPTFKGSNVTIDGTKAIITGGGNYLISGKSANGQVCVRTATEEKVKIILDGVDIANSSGPAVFIDEAKKCTVELKEGTESILRDGDKDKINDGVIFSNDTLRIKGGGKLVIESNNAHGIASDDDVIIESGTYEITSIKSGIYAHDDITINDGELRIFGGTNGLKSRGTLNINGGKCYISGGTKEEKSSVYAEGDFNYTGGYVYAAGNQVSVPTNTAVPYIVVDFKDSIEPGVNIEMLLDDANIATLIPHNNFRCLMVLSNDLAEGKKYATKLNGEWGESYTLTGGQNLVAFK